MIPLPTPPHLSSFHDDGQTESAWARSDKEDVHAPERLTVRTLCSRTTAVSSGLIGAS
jgi:hypothetical protein